LVDSIALTDQETQDKLGAEVERQRNGELGALTSWFCRMVGHQVLCLSTVTLTAPSVGVGLNLDDAKAIMRRIIGLCQPQAAFPRDDEMSILPTRQF
jgi:hypothetical protein